MRRERQKNAVLNDDSLDRWQKIKTKNQQCYNFIHKIDYSDAINTTSSDIAENLNLYSSSIGAKLNEEAKGMKSNSCEIEPSELATPFNFSPLTCQEVSYVEVSRYLNSLNSRKTGGLDQIPSFIY